MAVQAWQLVENQFHDQTVAVFLDYEKAHNFLILQTLVQTKKNFGDETETDSLGHVKTSHYTIRPVMVDLTIHQM